MTTHAFLTGAEAGARRGWKVFALRNMSLERASVALVFATLLCPLAAALARALGLRAAVAFGVGAATFLALLPWLVRALPAQLDGWLRRRPWSFGLWLVLAAAAMVLHGRVAVYIVEPEAGHVGLVQDAFYTPHSCLSAYYTAALVSRTDAPNLYDAAHYKKPKQGSPIGVFNQDDYFYPPPFLLLPRALLAMSGDFVRVRAAWFVMESLAVLAALAWLARRSGRASTAVWLSIPLVFGSVPVLATLQAGNFQVMALAIALLALLAVAARQNAVGGALLAMATVSKIFPGILIVYLIGRRRWSAVIWSAAFAGVYVALGIGVLGPRPFSAFLTDMLPRLSSGRAFSMLEQPAAIALNHSVTGVLLKLRLLGLASVSLAQAASATWIYTLVLVPLALLAGRWVRDDGPRALLLGFALLHLAALRSPFTPDPYATIVPLWLAVWGFALESSARRRAPVLGALAAAAVALQLMLPGFLAFTWPIERVLAVAALPQLVAWVVVITTVRASLAPERPAAEAGRSAAAERELSGSPERRVLS